MVSFGKFPTQPQCNCIILQNSVSKLFLFTTKTHLTKFTSFPNRISPLGFCCSWWKRTGCCIYASNSQGKGRNDLFEMDDFENFDEDDDLFEEEEDDREEGEDVEEREEEDEFIPLNNMKQWLRNKPRGFGEGRVYDTAIEDKLMEEIEQSRRAQLANINKLKNNSVQLNSKKDGPQQEKISEESKEEYQVRLVNLPKKKNIHRDLKLAFQGVHGIVDIAPVVSGNKRTRDPICKGLAFISFKSEKDAYRFVQSFTGKSIMFGKVQKQIQCELTAGMLQSGYQQFVGETSYQARPADHSLGLSPQDVSVEFKEQDEMHKSTEAEDDGEDLEAQIEPEPKRDGDIETDEEPVLKSSSSKKNEGIQEKEKKIASKKKKKNIPKFNIPGSANRLKIKEKEVLTGVFSKYGANASLATREQR